MEIYRKLILALVAANAFATSKEITEDRVVDIITGSKPSIVHDLPPHSPPPKNPPSGWSSGSSPGWSSGSSPGWSSGPSNPPPSCKTFPECNPLNSGTNCCECKNDLRRCCANGMSSSSEGYCRSDACQPCVTLGTSCYHNYQCCGSFSGSASCTNWRCCLPIGKSGCSKDADCCSPPVDGISGADCVAGTCQQCKVSSQTCTVAADCCSTDSDCGNKVSFTGDFEKISICCLTPGKDCRVGLDECCDTRSCTPPGSTSRFFCKTNAVQTQRELDEDKSGGWGWGSSGGWGPSGGWGGSSGNNTFPPGLSSGGGYLKGKCTACPPAGTSCAVDTDCCNGFTCIGSPKLCIAITSIPPDMAQMRTAPGDGNSIDDVEENRELYK